MPFSDYRVTSEYGWRTHPITGKRTFHAGIDLDKGHKSPITPFIGGYVLFAGMGLSGTGLGGYGNCVVIEDYNSHAHVYAHLHSINVKKGQTATRKTVLGTQGATGNVTGSHLHYEIRVKTSPHYGWTTNPENSTVNPIDYVKGGNVVAILKVDGKLGPKTISELQRYLGTPVDGKISEVSPMVKELQKRLNQGYL